MSDGRQKYLRALSVIVTVCAQSLVVHGKISDRVRAKPTLSAVTGSIVNEQLSQIQKEHEKGAGISELLIAAREGYVEALSYYKSQDYKSIESKVKIDLKNDHSALHVAAELGNVAVLRILIDILTKVGRFKENLEKYTSIADRPLQKAAANNREEAINYLLGVGADKDGRSSDYATPMHRAAANGHIEAVKCLIDNEADRDARTRNLVRPVDMAASNRHAEVVRCLLNYRLQTKNLSLFERAIENANNRHKEVVRYLLNCGLPVENIGPFMRSIENASNSHAQMKECLSNYHLPTNDLDLFIRSIENKDLAELVWLIKMQIYDFEDIKHLDEKT